MGKLYDDRGNRMSPSFSTKNGVRYRFYVSTALLGGRTSQVGSVGRVPAAEIERAVLATIQAYSKTDERNNDTDLEMVGHVVVARARLIMTVAQTTLNGDVEGIAEINARGRPTITTRNDRTLGSNPFQGAGMSALPVKGLV
jgi:hypothetical protein